MRFGANEESSSREALAGAFHRDTSSFVTGLPPATQPLKCISLWQPWASFIAGRLKRVETRSWGTRYRGPLAIHAAKAPKVNTVEADALLRKAYGRPPGMGGWFPFCMQRPLPGYPYDAYPLGAIVATCQLVDCSRVLDPGEPTENEFGEISLIVDDGHGTVRRRVSVAKPEFVLGNLFSEPGAWRWGWRLKDIRPIVTFPYSGRQGLFDVPAEVVARFEYLEAVA